nr:phosphate transporter PHO1 homolog 1 isoform X2 [Ipomoea trifida]
MCGREVATADGGLVHRKPSKGDLYETELLEQFADTEAANEFFARLDLQLNKVNQFYKTKEREFMERGESLKKQLEILIQLNAALRHHRAKGIGSSQESREDDSISGTISCDEESNRGRAEEEQGQGDNTDESSISETQLTESPGELGRSMRVKREDSKLRSLSERVASKKRGSEASRLHINKTKLRHAEKMIRGAFIELYKGLGYLKTYRNLNMLAFVKILKKFDKVTNKQVLPIYLRVVENSYFNSSDKAVKLADEVEEIFIKHFAEDDRRKAMKYLKPTLKKESHAVTFFIGLFAGCFIALFAGYIIMAHITGMYRQRKSDTVYMETVYPVLRQESI